ncbi:MAG TPA: NAD(P)-dependent oxidoreductase [Ilumatobacter sp.]|nr:NAD(P)-dependent oxidoreductase [Ilumatobacter sp.]
MVNVLLIGCGQIAVIGHLPALRILQDEGLVQVTACDPDAGKAQEAAARFGVKCATDWTELADGADAAIVCVPPGINAEIAVAALERGLHVLCEKPPGRTVEQSEAMAAAASRRPDLVTMIGFNRRFSPLRTEMMERSLRLGPVNSFYGRFSRPSLGGEPSNTASDWITADSSHALDLALATVGFPTRFSVSRRLVGRGEDNVWTVHLHSDDASAILLFNYAAGRRVETFEWAGAGYDVRLSLPSRAEWAQTGQPVETLTNNDDAATPSVGYGFLAEHRVFAAAVAGTGERPQTSFAYGAGFMRLVADILDTDSGDARAITAPALFEESKEEQIGRPLAISTNVRRPESRPSVFLHHPLATQAQYFPASALADLKSHADVRTWTGDDDQLDVALKDAQVVISGRGAPRLSRERLESAASLELLVVLGASVGQWEPLALLDRGIAIANTADAVAQIVAEHCLMVTLAGLRRLTDIDRAMHRGSWPRPGQPTGSQTTLARTVAKRLHIPDAVRPHARAALRAVRRARTTTKPAVRANESPSYDLRGEVVALIGWGHTARHFARLLQPFGCEILVASESGSLHEIAQARAKRVSVGEAIGSARVVSLHKGLTDRTRGCIGRPELAQLRPGAVFINAARGGLVDESALLARLSKGDIVAALDVFEEEPLPQRHPFRSLDNVILTPHNASSTAQEAQRIGDQAVQTVLSWIAGDEIELISTERLARMT